MSKKVINWICFVFFFFSFLTFISQSVSGIFFLFVSALFFPPLLKHLNNRNKLPKKRFRIILGIGLFLLGLMFVPATDTTNQANTDLSKAEQTIQETNNETETETESVTEPESEIETETNQEEDLEELITPTPTPSPTVTPTPQVTQEAETPVSTEYTDKQALDLSVHFIDVGQGDSILVESNNHYMLIDAGENNQGSTVVQYLKSQGVKYLDFVIGTHPHSDHIGGLDNVIRSFDIGKIIMPDATHTTATFEDVIDAIASKNLKITKAVAGDTYTIGTASFTIIAPNSSSYDDLNDYSVGIKLTNGNNSFVLTGDAEASSEKEMLKNKINLSADVLKLGHHGSTTSSHDNFLDAVSPNYAVISVGKDNSYGHPHVEILQEMLDRNINVFRTDQQGTIIFHSDGKNITTSEKPYTISKTDLVRSSSEESTNNNSNKNQNTDSSTNKEVMVHITETGSKYHVAGCRYLKSDIEVTLDNALSKGLKPCKTCNPPTK